MINPIKQLRSKYNLTQRELAELAGMSPTAILRYEQGLYQHISEKITASFDTLDPGDIRVQNLPITYQAWRRQHQFKARSYVHPLPNLTVEPMKHPFVTWRECVTRRAVGKESRVSFCILLAVHPSVVLDYENAKQARMPRLISDALVNAGVDIKYINNLDDLGAIYYDRTHSTAV